MDRDPRNTTCIACQHPHVPTPSSQCGVFKKCVSGNRTRASRVGSDYVSIGSVCERMSVSACQLRSCVIVNLRSIMLLCIVSRSCLCLTWAHPTMSCIPLEVVNLCGHNLDTIHPDWRHRPSAQVQSSSVQFMKNAASPTQKMFTCKSWARLVGVVMTFLGLGWAMGDRPYAELPIFYCYGNIHNTIKWVGSRSRSDIQH